MFSKLFNPFGLLIPCVACLFTAKCLACGLTAVFNLLQVWGGGVNNRKCFILFVFLKLFVGNTTSHVNLTSTIIMKRLLLKENVRIIHFKSAPLSHASDDQCV